MGVKLEIGFQKGWKAKINGRFGPAIVIKFVNDVTGKIMFTYAPKHKDRKVWIKLFDALEKYDKEVVNIIELQKEFDNLK